MALVRVGGPHPDLPGTWVLITVTDVRFWTLTLANDCNKYVQSLAFFPQSGLTVVKFIPQSSLRDEYWSWSPAESVLLLPYVALPCLASLMPVFPRVRLAS